MDDDKPVDATIRPALPSRAAIPAPADPWAGKDPEWDDAPGGPVDTPQFHNPQLAALEMFSAARKKETPVKRTKRVYGDIHPKTKKPDARRSAAARDAWKTRRKNAKVEAAYESGPVLITLALASKLTDEELGGFRVAVEMLQKLPASSRKLVLDALVKVFP